MTCEETIALLPDRLQGFLAADDEQRVANHIEGCASCRKEAAALAALWADMGAQRVEVPHERMRARFHAALAAYDERSSAGLLERIAEWLVPRRLAAQAAFAAALLVAGVVIGQRLPRADGEISALRAEVRTVGLALLDHQSASERLLGVAWSQRVEPEPAVVAALLERVEYDTNLNVRLAAVEALRAHLDTPEVTVGLAGTLARQDAPLVQIAVADALLDGGGMRGAEAVRALLERSGIEPSVRDYLGAELQAAGTGSGADI
jgi:predicted anti-sigma-YlaC factor YlaD